MSDFQAFPGEFLPPDLSPDDRQELAKLALSALRATAEGREWQSGCAASGTLGRVHGVFVTLSRQGKLRGCIGTAHPSKPLGEGVVEYAQAAAARDPRFSPVTEEELPDLHIEISVLSTLADLPVDPDRVLKVLRPGLHGLCLELGERRGLLLPQVATRLGLDAEGFLEGVAEKAGLEPEGWRRAEARLRVFTVTSFAVREA